ncbi:jg13439 [Pararge aegeria aegeria]|uniref:Jg13439 protein n=1 Tax=Pararge aegeria aegeria TaxID=348720 RepID=A0A8S4R0S0_9NEOP|nr:jg13439 [Pararge aegeria aegeria]
MDTLQAMSSNKEARKLHADNRRMQKELSALRAEVKALRSSFSAREKSPAVGQPAYDANLQTSPAFVEMNADSGRNSKEGLRHRPHG